MKKKESFKKTLIYKNGKNWWKAISSFLLVLFTMPLGHALMILMERLMDPVTMHYAAFFMGAIGLVLVIIGVFSIGDTKQTLLGLLGGLLFWTGWVEFLFMYYANRHGAQPEIVNGEIVTRPEYLILSASFGLWVMVMLLYVFCVKTGCSFITWWQKVIFRKHKNRIVSRSMTRHTSIVTFMELNMLLWACYLLLMFCYDNRFLGDHHPVTFIVGIGCFIGSVFIFKRQLCISSWGANIRMAIASVIVFWTPVEILGRMNFFKEIWTDPMNYKTEMMITLICFILLTAYLWYVSSRKRVK